LKTLYIKMKNERASKIIQRKRGILITGMG